MFFSKKKNLCTVILIFSLFANSVSVVSVASVVNEQSYCIDEEQSLKNDQRDCSLIHENENQQIEPEPQDVSISKEKLDGVKVLAEKFDLPFEEILEKLHFKENCYLIPLQKIEEHKNCLLDVFSNANPEYMKYYLDGKLKPLEKVERIFYVNSLKRMWQGKIPKSLNFIIDVNNNSVGRIAVGPLYDRGTIDSEIGYAIKEGYSRKGITSEAVKTLIELLRYLIKSGKYDIEKIRATAKEGNIASNKILQKNDFIKMPDMIDDGYSPENEYFYYFK